jgi:hypothetical protein
MAVAVKHHARADVTVPPRDENGVSTLLDQK